MPSPIQPRLVANALTAIVLAFGTSDASTESRADSRVALHISWLAVASACADPDVSVKALFCAEELAAYRQRPESRMNRCPQGARRRDGRSTCLVDPAPATLLRSAAIGPVVVHLAEADPLVQTLPIDEGQSLEAALSRA